jgi:hypothetical protein
MMDDEHTMESIRKSGVTRNRLPYKYKMNRKKRAVAEQEGFYSDEEEV